MLLNVPTFVQVTDVLSHSYYLHLIYVLADEAHFIYCSKIIYLLLLKQCKEFCSDGIEITEDHNVLLLCGSTLNRNAYIGVWQWVRQGVFQRACSMQSWACLVPPD